MHTRPATTVVGPLFLPCRPSIHTTTSNHLQLSTSSTSFLQQPSTPFYELPSINCPIPLLAHSGSPRKPIYPFWRSFPAYISRLDRYPFHLTRSSFLNRFFTSAIPQLDPVSHLSGFLTWTGVSTLTLLYLVSSSHLVRPGHSLSRFSYLTSPYLIGFLTWTRVLPSRSASQSSHFTNSLHRATTGCLEYNQKSCPFLEQQH